MSTPESVTIRRIRTTDTLLLRTLRLTMLEDSPRAYDTDPGLAKAYTTSWWQQWCEQAASSADRSIFLAFSSGISVGMIASDIVVDTHNSVTADTGALWVDPAHRNKGIASQLFKYVESWAASSGADEVVLGVSAENTRAHELYVRLGYEDTGATVPTRWNTSEILMRKVLPAPHSQ
jgi:ribosomal protein S18 acetylase RimI-like enzyme